jgi:hypothetical protein
LVFYHNGRTRAEDNRVLGNVFGPKEEEAKKSWRKLHKEELV